MNVVVIGLGAMGSAALAHLARRGHRPTGLEQFVPGHDRGSSHGWSRVIRQAYFEHADYVPLLKRAFALWDELEQATGAEVLHRNGVLILGPPDSAAIRLSRESAALHGIEVEPLSARSLAERFPQFHVPADYHALLEPGAGFAIPEHGNAAHLEVATRAGAVVRSDVAVHSIAADGDGVRLETSDGVRFADRVIVTAGAWTKGLLPGLNVRLEPQRKVIAWFGTRDAAACASDRMPVWLVDDGGARGQGVYYGVPTWPGQVGPPGVKVGFHGPGAPVVPGTRTDVEPAELRLLEEHMRDLLPVLGPPRSATTCLYTMSPDEHFVIGEAPIPGVIVAGGFSGHGYKFAPAIGEVLADLAVDQAPTTDIGFLSPTRFVS